MAVVVILQRRRQVAPKTSFMFNYRGFNHQLYENYRGPCYDNESRDHPSGTWPTPPCSAADDILRAPLSVVLGQYLIFSSTGKLVIFLVAASCFGEVYNSPRGELQAR